MALDEAQSPDPTDFTLSAGTVSGTGVIVSGSKVYFQRTTNFAHNEVVTFSYTPNSNASKRIRGASAGGEVLAITNYSITNNVL